jgi:hypothetical protein
MLRTVSPAASVVRKLLQNLPAAGAIMRATVAPWFLPRQQPARMKPIVLVLALLIATGAAAQGPPAAPVPGPSPAPPSSRGDLWQLLTPDQREQLWRSLTPEQRSDVWRGLQPQERREMRERLGPGEVGGGAPWAGWRHSDRGAGPAGKSMMTPEERQQMREQIREAHRLRREQMEAERARRAQ